MAKTQPESCGLGPAFQTIGGKWKAELLWLIRAEPRRFGELKQLVPKPFSVKGWPHAPASSFGFVEIDSSRARAASTEATKPRLPGPTHSIPRPPIEPDSAIAR